MAETQVCLNILHHAQNKTSTHDKKNPNLGQLSLCHECDECYCEEGNGGLSTEVHRGVV